MKSTREASHCYTDIFQAFRDEAAESITPPEDGTFLSSTMPPGIKNERALPGISLSRSIDPPYSRDVNPVERIWLIMKAEHCTNIHGRDKAALIERADLVLYDLMDNPKRGASAAGSIRNEL